MRRTLGTAIIAIALLAAPGALPAQPSLSSGTVMEAVERLKPGEYLWAPGLAPQGPMLMVVNLATQRLVLYRNGIPIAISTVSTGRPGYSTPTGIYTILERDEVHFSSTYDNAPMPYMQRLTWGGVSLHGGALPGYPASHGCIRLPHEFARLLYGETRLGMTVVVTDRPSLPRVAPSLAPLAAAADAGEPASSEAMSWHPERAPTGPVSIVISGADKKAVVLRNGTVIGSGPIETGRPIDGTSAFLLQSISDGKRNWVRILLPGQAETPSGEADKGQGIVVPDAFRDAVVPILRPGATVVLTADSLASAASGQPLTLLSDDKNQTRAGQ